MLGIKKIDKFVFNSFILLFIGNFFISLFVFMMQFLWKYVDDLVGKGLDMYVIFKFFFYCGLTCVPAALPLAVLLTSLITFGNLGERYELLAMKAAGVPLVRIMRSLVLFSVFTVFVSFYFQNVVAPFANKSLGTIFISIKQKNPEVQVPENVFYSGVRDYKIRVKKKDRKTGMLYNVLIYDFREGFDNANIMYADSAKMENISDQSGLFLRLYSGDLFQNLRAQNMNSENVPYRRESFREKHIFIEYDSNFNMTDTDIMSGQSVSKNIQTLTTSIDSMKHVADSIGNKFYRDISEGSLHVSTWQSCEAGSVDASELNLDECNVDSIFASMSLEDKKQVLTSAYGRVNSESTGLSSENFIVESNDYNLRRHKIEWHKKFTISLSCLLFLFIGAPLGAIIRKGGLGIPVVLSVLIFITYYLIDSTGYKMARDDVWVVWVGMWFSTMILLPLGAYLTYKSNKDAFSVNLNDSRIKKLISIIKYIGKLLRITQ